MKSLIFCFLLVSVMVKGQDNQAEASKEKIRKIFSDWQVAEIKAHHFWAPDSCNWEWMDTHPFDGTIDEMLGFPDQKEIQFYFEDVNQDGKLDGLVTFNPKQCDGGNASMWDQYQILIVSDKQRYKIKAEFSAGTSLAIGATDRGFYWLDGIAPNQLLGTYYQFKDGDGRCCPSIQRRVVINYRTRKMRFP